MKETTLLKIALVCSLAGLIALYFISQRIEVKDYKPAELNKNVGDDVKLKGAVTKIDGKGNVVFVDLKNENYMTVVLFTSENDLKLKNGDNIEVIGKVQEYNGKNEIIAQNIRVVR